MHLLIIGAGPGGYETAVEAVKRGMTVTIVTDGPLGGTCLNEGCIPTKTMCHYAGLLEENRKAGLDVNLDFSKVVERRKSVIDGLRAGIETLLRNVEVVYGRACFKDSRTVSVEGREYFADRIIIATGSVPAFLPVPGASETMTSADILSLTEVPSELCVIGGGVIGLEFASVFSAFGSKVTVLEYCREILPRFDTDIAKRLRQALVRRGISIETQACVTSVGGGTVTYTKKDTGFEVKADRILMAVGRRANVEGLCLEAAGVEYGGRGIPVDENCRTNVDGIYAIGDVTGGMMLAHTASYQGIRALNDIQSVKDGIRFDLVPAAVFTMPEVATVGLTEEECREKGIDVKVVRSFYRANGKAVSMDESDGYCKLLANTGDGTIAGCHIMGAHAADLIHEAAALMNCGATIDCMRNIIHAHPTLNEVLQSAFRQ